MKRIWEEYLVDVIMELFLKKCCFVHWCLGFFWMVYHLLDCIDRGANILNVLNVTFAACLI